MAVAPGDSVALLHYVLLSDTGDVNAATAQTEAAAAAFATRDRGITGLQWAIDPDKAAWTDLRVTGVPSLFGVRNGTVEWRLAGVLNDPTALRSIITSWTGQVAHDTPTFVMAIVLNGRPWYGDAEGVPIDADITRRVALYQLLDMPDRYDIPPLLAAAYARGRLFEVRQRDSMKH